MRYIFLPPYSPNFNPIELAFSALKSRIRRVGAELRETMTSGDSTAVYAALYDVTYSVESEDAHGFFRHCNYL